MSKLTAGLVVVNILCLWLIITLAMETSALKKSLISSDDMFEGRVAFLEKQFERNEYLRQDLIRRIDAVTDTVEKQTDAIKKW